MNTAERIEYINQNPLSVLQPDNSGKGYICPLCQSGTGRKGTGLTERNGRYTCWKCREINNDTIFNIIGKLEGIDEQDTAGILKAAEKYGFTFTGNIKPVAKREPAKKEPPEDYTAFYADAAANLNQTDYWKNRGISQQTAEKYKLGFIENWQSPKALKEGKKPPASPRLIIPTSAVSYVARDTRQQLTEDQKSWAKMKAGPVHIFNLQAIEEAAGPVFIVEGEIDALSLIELGADAIGLGSTGMYKTLAEHLKTHRPTQPLVLSLDADKAGQEAQQKLKAELDQLGIAYKEYTFKGGKDANEILIKDRQNLEAQIKEAIAQPDNTQMLTEAYNQNSADNYIELFKQEIKDSANRPPISTGFTNLDETLEGGLFAGLYVIGAVSSLGKTTFCLQLADQIAANNIDILFFSLEMDRYEIMAKSISRLTYLQAKSTDNAATTREIMTGSKYKFYSQQKKDNINAAIDLYAACYAPNIFIEIADTRKTVEDIRAKVEEHRRARHKTPVVIIDYLQIIKGTEPRATDKQNTDNTIIALKHLSRDFKTPVIVISSFNRENYTAAANMAAFKESGGIEYSADILIGLQLAGIEDADKYEKQELEDTARQNAKNPDAAQNIELKVLKNRNGRKDTIAYKFKPMFNAYEEGEPIKDELDF